MSAPPRAPLSEGRAARMRFLLRLERLVRFWVWVLGAGIVAVLWGLAPSVLAVVAIMGVVWVPIVALVLWGRLLDDMVPWRRDGEGGCR